MFVCGTLLHDSRSTCFFYVLTCQLFITWLLCDTVWHTWKIPRYSDHRSKGERRKSLRATGNLSNANATEWELKNKKQRKKYNETTVKRPDTFCLLTKPWGQDGNGGLNILNRKVTGLGDRPKHSQTRDKIAFASSLSNYTKEFVLFLRLNTVVFVRLHEPCGVRLPLWKIWPCVNQGCIKIMNMKGNQRK